MLFKKNRRGRENISGSSSLNILIYYEKLFSSLPELFLLPSLTAFAMCLSTPGPNAGQQVSENEQNERKATRSTVASLKRAGEAGGDEKNKASEGASPGAPCFSATLSPTSKTSSKMRHNVLS